MFFHLFKVNSRGYSLIELLIAFAVIVFIALTIANFTTVSLRTNSSLTTNTTIQNQATRVFSSINNEAKFGYSFTVTNSGHTLSFLTSDYTAAGTGVIATISLVGNNVQLSRTDGITKNLNTRSIINNLSFTVDGTNPSNVVVTLSLSGKNYSSTIRGLNYVP